MSSYCIIIDNYVFGTHYKALPQFSPTSSIHVNIHFKSLPSSSCPLNYQAACNGTNVINLSSFNHKHDNSRGSLAIIGGRWRAFKLTKRHMLAWSFSSQIETCAPSEWTASSQMGIYTFNLICLLQHQQCQKRPATMTFCDGNEEGAAAGDCQRGRCAWMKHHPRLIFA
jgi:hypothetical protein